MKGQFMNLITYLIDFTLFELFLQFSDPTFYVKVLCLAPHRLSPGTSDSPSCIMDTPTLNRGICYDVWKTALHAEMNSTQGLMNY